MFAAECAAEGCYGLGGDEVRSLVSCLFDFEVCFSEIIISVSDEIDGKRDNVTRRGWQFRYNINLQARKKREGPYRLV